MNSYFEFGLRGAGSNPAGTAEPFCSLINGRALYVYCHRLSLICGYIKIEAAGLSSRPAR